MTCWRKEPGHQQPWYLLCWTGLIRSTHIKGWYIFFIWGFIRWPCMPTHSNLATKMIKLWGNTFLYYRYKNIIQKQYIWRYVLYCTSKCCQHSSILRNLLNLLNYWGVNISLCGTHIQMSRMTRWFKFNWSSFLMVALGVSFLTKCMKNKHAV